MLGKGKTMVLGVRAMLDLHLEWVVLHVNVRNVFNLVFRTTIYI